MTEWIGKPQNANKIILGHVTQGKSHYELWSNLQEILRIQRDNQTNVESAVLAFRPVTSFRNITT